MLKSTDNLEENLGIKQHTRWLQFSTVDEIKVDTETEQQKFTFLYHKLRT